MCVCGGGRLCPPHCYGPILIFRPSYGPNLSVRHKVFRKTGDMEDNSNAVRFKKHFFTVLLGGIGGKMAIKNNASTGTPKAIGQKRRKTRENKALSTQISQLGLQLAQNYFWIRIKFHELCDWHFIWPFGPHLIFVKVWISNIVVDADFSMWFAIGTKLFLKSY